MKSKKAPTPDMETVMPLLIGMWRRLSKLSGPSEVLQTREFRGVVNAIEELQKGLETGSRLIGEDYFKDPVLLGAYLLYPWVVHYQQGLALMNELPSPPRRVLDLASGPGALSFAALRHGASEVIALDRNAAALLMAGQVCGRSGYPLSTRTHNVLRFPFPVEGQFDLITIGHSLEELFPSSGKGWAEAQLKWIKEISHLLTPQGIILFIESSQLHANHRLLALRDQLVKQGIPVQAPCVWKGACPALEKKSLCYAQRKEFEKPFVVKEIQRAASINLGSLKMSYLMIRKPGAEWPTVPEYPVYRVISPPIETHSGVRFHLCGTDGKKDVGSHIKELPTEAKAFEYLKRGELISLDGVVDRQGHFDIVLGSKVKVEAPLNKPLPWIDTNI
jgi:ubiquinone/menaquinone biosynthesis C-methylase UbiE